MILHLSNTLCAECGHDKFIIVNIIKGGGYKKRVDRYTCKSCGFESSRESNANEEAFDMEEEDIRKETKLDKDAKSQLD